MDIEGLPQHMRESFLALKHGAYTIECDIAGALEQANDLSDFQETVKTKMQDLMAEARAAIADFCSKKEIVFTISLKTPCSTESLEKLEDAFRDLLVSKGVDASIEDDGTGNTTRPRLFNGHGEEKTWPLWNLTQGTIEEIARQKGLSLAGRDLDDIARQTKKGIDAALDFVWEEAIENAIRNTAAERVFCGSSEMR